MTVKFRQAGREQTDQFSENSAVELRTGPYPYLRKAFEITKPVAKARLYATALGTYEISVNDHRIGDERLAPGWTDYRKRVQYRAFDVTAALKEGRNAIGAMIGPGWFCGRAGLFHISRFYGDAPSLLAQLEITYADGTSERIVTDGSWQRRDGPIVASDIMDGEIYDARLEAPTFASPVLSATDGTGWQPVTVRKENRNLVAQVDLGAGGVDAQLHPQGPASRGGGIEAILKPLVGVGGRPGREQIRQAPTQPGGQGLAAASRGHRLLRSWVDGS